jgi:hypothetical protein
VLPTPGTILDGTGGSRETAGRYRYRAATSAQVEAAIRATIAGYRMDWEPLTGDSPAAGGQPNRATGRVQAVVYS